MTISLIILFLYFSLSAPEAGAQNSLPWKSISAPVLSHSSKRILNTDQMISCRHLNARYKMLNESYFDIQWISKHMLQKSVILDTEDSMDALDYILNRHKFKAIEMASNYTHLVSWKIPEVMIAPDTQAIALASAAYFSLSDESFLFRNPRVHFKKVQNFYELTAEMRPVDACWIPYVSLIVLSQCPIDRTQFYCDRSPCPNPPPVIDWPLCQIEIIPLSLTSTKNNLSVRSESIRRLPREK